MFANVVYAVMKCFQGEGVIVLKWKLDELKHRYEHLSGHTLSYRDIANGSRVSLSTVSKILNHQSQAADFEVADKLLKYFSDKLGYQLTVTDIIGYDPVEKAHSQ